MNTGAVEAYERINEKVTANLIAAREVLERLKTEAKQQMTVDTDSGSSTRKTITVPDYSIVPQIVKPSSKKEKEMSIPPPIIRPPEDSPRKLPKKPEQLVFPDARIRSNGCEEKRGRCPNLENLDSFYGVQNNPIRTSKPDTLFPSASFIRKQKENQSFTDHVDSSAVSRPNSGYKTKKLDSLVNLKSIKTKEKQNRVPDELFPKADYIVPDKDKKILNVSSSSEQTDSRKSTSSLSTTNFPMTFISSDGKLKMLLTKNGKGQTTIGTMMPVTMNEMNSPSESSDEGAFPLVPRQLASSQNLLKTNGRHKFNAKIMIGPHSVDIFGLYNTREFNAETVEKIIINGTPYKV